MFNNMVDGLPLSSLCKSVCLESLVVQTTYKLVFDVDVGYVWTRKLSLQQGNIFSSGNPL